jgi:hypothetical protein
MIYMKTNEMQPFDLALQRLVEKAKSAGKSLTPEEITRRMLIVQSALIFDPEVFEACVLSDDFSVFQRTFCGDVIHPQAERMETVS